MAYNSLETAETLRETVATETVRVNLDEVVRVYREVKEKTAIIENLARELDEKTEKIEKLTNELTLLESDRRILEGMNNDLKYKNERLANDLKKSQVELDENENKDGENKDSENENKTMEEVSCESTTKTREDLDLLPGRNMSSVRQDICLLSVQKY